MNSKRLVTSAQAAKILNLSIQGIHYRIKNGQLKAIKENGKTLVYIADSLVNENNYSSNEQVNNNISDQIISEKNNQIKILKKYIKQSKNQYQNEINRLEQNQDKIISVFQSEIDLLQSAFNELRNLYKLDHPTHTATHNYTNLELMDIKEFFILMRKHSKTNKQIKAIILDKVKANDRRFIYDKNSKSIVIYKSDFLDLI